MPRNDQVTRQWYLLRQLESSRGMTLQELADSVPDDHPKHLRTIRRDLDALGTIYPLVTEREDGQTRWKVMEGYRQLPALKFSPTELIALTFSHHLLKPLEGTQIHASLASALNKAAAALPSQAQDFSRQMQDLFSIGLGPHKKYRQHRETIDRLARAIDQHRTIQMRYYSASRNKTTRREVDPHRLWYAGGALYLIAYDHRRGEVRLFAVDRIKSLTLTNHAYQIPLGFDVDAYVEDALVIMRGNRITVELVFGKATAAWVKDRIWHSSQQATPLKDGRLKMTLQVADTRELVGWILSFGNGARVLSPMSLRAKVRDEARKILQQK
ncbi:MAG TPA: WYL domain-containing protein [Methylomirabilota bacterium]|nr:WYL domain-containing protein [Methylomirabilota bacterium]